MNKTESLEQTYRFMLRGLEGFADNKVELLDGTLIECHPITTDSTQPDCNGMSEAERIQFIEHAHLFYDNKERILHESRMLLCPIDFNSGMTFADLSVFKRPTLGVYLQWWSIYGGTWTNEQGQKGLICKMAGSGLTGANCCTIVYKDGSVGKKLCIDNFKDRLKTFIRINRAYTNAKERYEYYSLNKVINILKSTQI